MITLHIESVCQLSVRNPVIPPIFLQKAELSDPFQSIQSLNGLTDASSGEVSHFQILHYLRICGRVLKQEAHRSHCSPGKNEWEIVNPKTKQCLTRQNSQ